MSSKDFADQVLELRRERDLARSDAILMERMYHNSLTISEGYMKQCQALSDWQKHTMPDVRAVREILRQRPDLRGPDGIVTAVLSGGASARPLGEDLQPSNQVTKAESHCVGEITRVLGGAVGLRCANCGVLVAFLAADQAAEFKSDDDLRHYWRGDWNQHITIKNFDLPVLGSGAGPTPTPPGPAPSVFEDENLIPDCIELIRKEGKARISFLQRRLTLGYTRAARIMDELERLGVVGPRNENGEHEILPPKKEDRMTEIAELDQPANPNAGVKQAFPKGRW